LTPLHPDIKMDAPPFSDIKMDLSSHPGDPSSRIIMFEVVTPTTAGSHAHFLVAAEQ
jgi:hypothetical protein